MKKFFTLSAMALMAGTALAGNMALKVTCPEGKTNAWDSQVFINFPTPLEAGKNYTLLMDVKGSVALTPIQGQYGFEAIQPILQDNNSENRDQWGGPADLVYLSNFTVTEDWVKDVTDCDGNPIVSDGQFPYSRLLLNLGKYAGDFYVDNIRLVDEAGTETFNITFDTPEEQALVENGWMNLAREFVELEEAGGDSGEGGSDTGDVVVPDDTSNCAVHLKAKSQWASYGLSAECPFSFEKYVDYKITVANVVGSFNILIESAETHKTTPSWSTTEIDESDVIFYDNPVVDGTIEGSVLRGATLKERMAEQNCTQGIRNISIQACDGDTNEIDILEVILITPEGKQVVQKLGVDAWGGGAYEATPLEYTGIETIESEPATTTYTFNLMGQRTQATKGLMVRNGKLIMVK